MSSYFLLRGLDTHVFELAQTYRATKIGVVALQKNYPSKLIYMKSGDDGETKIVPLNQDQKIFDFFFKSANLCKLALKNDFFDISKFCLPTILWTFFQT